MSAGAGATGPRRGPPGLEEATSKKKQKDQANQESKDGDPRRGRSDVSRVLMASSSLITGHANRGSISSLLYPGLMRRKRPMASSVEPQLST